MANNFKFDVFISHSSKDKKIVRLIAERLRADGLRVWFDEWEIKTADCIPAKIDDGLENSRVLVLCMSANAFGSDWALLESYTFRFRDPLNRERHFIPLRLDDTPIKGSLAQFCYIKWLPKKSEQEYTKLLSACRADKPISGSLAPLPGTIPVRDIHDSKSRLPGEVFAVELLTRPLQLFRDKETGRFKVIVDRRDIGYALTTNAEKSKACKAAVAGKRESLAECDHQIHQFLLGRSTQDRLVVDPKLLVPLRWASGGVLSVVKGAVAGNNRDWTPFWFRDIKPSGWNLALGASERKFDKDGKLISEIEPELNDPNQFILREFLEETLVIDGEPNPGHDQTVKQFLFGDTSVAVQRNWAAQFSNRHLHRRLHDDGLLLHREQMNDDGAGPAVIHAMNVFDTKTDLVIIDRDGREHFKPNVFVTINLLEMGIEIVKVLNYHLNPNDYILDGEILLRDNGDAGLVRMPCAFISHDALKRSFSPETYEPRYTDDDSQPSIISNPFEASEIKCLSWDVKQRLMPNSSVPPEKQVRFSEFREKFGHMFDEMGELRPEPIPEKFTFTPSTAKTLSLYFQRKSEQ